MAQSTHSPHRLRLLYLRQIRRSAEMLAEGRFCLAKMSKARMEELHEIQESPSLIVYEVRYGEKAETFEWIGEAYIEVGTKAGKAV